MIANKSLAVFLALALMATNAYAGTDADYAKTVTGEGGVLHSLAKASKSMLPIFDAMPKIRLYKYTGTAATKYFGKGDRGNDKSPHGRVFYPSTTTNHQYYEMEYNIATANEKNMLVTITDLDLMDEGGKLSTTRLWLNLKNLAYRCRHPLKNKKLRYWNCIATCL